MELSTRLVHAGVRRDPRTGAVSTPIYQSATFQHPALGQTTGYDYSRSVNPTRQALEEAMADLEGGVRGFAFASGMAAVTALLHLLQPRDHLVVTADLYGGTYRVLMQVFAQLGLVSTFVDTSDRAAVAAAWRPETRMLFVETPTNPMMRVADLAALGELCQAHGAIFTVDNTFLSPFLQQPIALGADLVVHSASKYLAGHNDVIAGVVVAARADLAERVGFLQNATGGILGPQDSWLTLRGLKTLGLRMQKAQENAQAIAGWLAEHPQVSAVHYPGLPSHPGHAVNGRQAAGPGSMLAFNVRDPRLVAGILQRVQLVLFAESLGGVETLITYPWSQTHADVPEDLRRQLGIDDTLLRLSVGIEDARDLMADLAQALDGAAAEVA